MTRLHIGLVHLNRNGSHQHLNRDYQPKPFLAAQQSSFEARHGSRTQSHWPPRLKVGMRLNPCATRTSEKWFKLALRQRSRFSVSVDEADNAGNFQHAKAISQRQAGE